MKRLFSHSEMIERLELFKQKISSMKIDADSIQLSSAAMHGYRKKQNVPKGSSLEKWGTSYGLNLNWLLWNEGEMIIQNPEDSNTTALDQLHALKTRIRDLQKIIDQQEETLALYRERRQEGSGHRPVTADAPTKNTAPSTSPRDNE